MTFPLRTIFSAFGTGLALSGAAMAQDISVAVVGPMTGRRQLRASSSRTG